MNIFLVGFMGSGKTTIGRKLAKALNLTFYDLDLLIEEKTKRSIVDIFKYLGEDAFREIEAECLRTFEHKNAFVLATGGGAPCYHDNMNFILQQGISIYIEMDAKSIFDRLKKSKKIRPAIRDLSDENLKKFISENLQVRLPIYQKANHHIHGINSDIEQIVALLR